MSHEYQTVAITRTVHDWRTVHGCILNTAKVQTDRTQQNRLYQMARDLEANLPLLFSSEGSAKR